LSPGMPLGRVHARDQNAADEGERRLRAAYTIGPGAAPEHPLIADRLSPPLAGEGPAAQRSSPPGDL
jgi:hypothetical protein